MAFRRRRRRLEIRFPVFPFFVAKKPRGIYLFPHLVSFYALWCPSYRNEVHTVKKESQETAARLVIWFRAGVMRALTIL